MLLKLNGLAVFVFLLLSLSDALDGYLARRFNQISDLGKFLDPLADKILVISALITLVGLGKAAPIPVIILTARELVVQGIRIAAAQHQVIMAASPIAKLKTVVQIIAIVMLILDLPFNQGVLWSAVVLSLISGGAYFWQSKILKQLK